MLKQLAAFDQTTLQQQADSFTISLQSFLRKYPTLAPLIENHPIDHLAIKAYATEDYELYLKSAIPSSELPVTATAMDDRRIATALLKKPISLSSFGETNVLEIIEPKPAKAETADARFDHIEIRNPEFVEIEKSLKELNIAYTPYENPKHKALVIVINDLGQEIKFTNGNLAEIVKTELAEGKAVEVTS